MHHLLPGRRVAMAIAAASIAAITTFPGPAEAEQTTIDDPRRDVVDEHHDDVVVPQAASSDILKARVRHTAHTIDVRTVYRDLRRGADQVTQVLIVINREVYGAAVTTSPAHPRGLVSFGGDSGASHCDLAVAHRLSYRRDFVRVVVPRRCLSNPRTIRVAVTAWRGALLDGAGQDGADGTGPPTYTEALSPG